MLARHTTRTSCRRIALSLMSAAILSGCMSQREFRVVDAKSGEPLRDVRVERLEGGYRPSTVPLVVVNDLSPAEKQTTNESGTARFDTSGSKFMVNPSGQNPSYNHAYVTSTWSGVKVLYPSEHREVLATRKNGIIEIPLERRLADSDEPRSATASSQETLR